MKLSEILRQGSFWALTFLLFWQKAGAKTGIKTSTYTHNETNAKKEKAENPCPARIIGKRKSSIVSDTLVSKLSNLFGAGKGTRTLKLARRNLNPVCLPISSYPHIQFFTRVGAGKPSLRWHHLNPMSLPIPPHPHDPLFLHGEVPGAGHSAWAAVYILSRRRGIVNLLWKKLPGIDKGI